MDEYLVRYGQMRKIGVFRAPDDQTYSRDEAVIVRTDRGLEVGCLLGVASPDAVEKIKDPIEGQILRRMSAEDAAEVSRIRGDSRREMDICKKYIDRLGLVMNLVDVEHIFGGERVIVYYLAEGRVDFRELVRLLAAEFQTRIEMRQIGVRDEAKLLADYGDCGKSVCCNTHLSQMPPVSMKMAKLQKATLDPTKISGRCGRLKCCLRYEFDTYEELQRGMPSIGSQVRCEEGVGKVIGQEVLAGQILVVLEDHRHLLINASQVELVHRGSGSRRGEGRRQSRDSRDDAEKQETRSETADNKNSKSSKDDVDEPANQDMSKGDSVDNAISSDD